MKPISRKNKNILPPREFLLRILRFSLLTFALLLFCLLVGIAGYRSFGSLGWVDSFYNASMILTGMGPINDMPTAGGKIFASLYAIFSGIFFLSIVAVFFSPFAHRLMHLLKVDSEQAD